MENGRKSICLFLTLFLLMSMIPLMAHAEEETPATCTITLYKGSAADYDLSDPANSVTRIVEKGSTFVLPDTVDEFQLNATVLCWKGSGYPGVPGAGTEITVEEDMSFYIFALKPVTVSPTVRTADTEHGVLSVTQGSSYNLFQVEVTPEEGFYLLELYRIDSAGERYNYSLSNDGYHGGTKQLTIDQDSVLYAEFAPLKEPVEIHTVKEFREFRDSVNDGTDSYAGGRVILTADLDLENEEWVCIGTVSNKFHGDFDGQGHAVRGLNAVANTDNYAALFGRCTGNISNLSVYGTAGPGQLAAGIAISANQIKDCNSYVTVNGSFYAYGIGGASAYHCKNYGDVFAHGSRNPAQCASGIGDSHSEQCVNYGSIEGDTWAAGIQQSGSVRECVNKGTVVAGQNPNFTLYGQAGGIVAEASGSIEISDCYNTGDVTAYSQASKADGDPWVGGILGHFYPASEHPVIVNCYNTGIIKKGGYDANKEAHIGEITASKYLAGNSYAGWKLTEISEDQLTVTNCWKASDIQNMTSSEAVQALGTAYKEDAGGVNDNQTPLLNWEDGVKDTSDHALRFRITGPKDYTVTLFKDSDQEQTISPDEDGVFHAPNGRYPYTVKAKGYEAVSGMAVIKGYDADVSITMNEAYSVTFKVAPENANFAITKDGKELTPEVQGNNQYTCILVPDVEYEYSAEAEGYIGITRSYRAVADNTVEEIYLTKSLYDDNAPSDAYIYGDGNTGKTNTISKGGMYYIGDGATGIMTIDTKEAVTLIGKGISDAALYGDLFLDCKQAGTKLTLQDVGVSEGENTANLINYTGKDNVLSIEGVCLLDYDFGYTSQHDALIHVPQDGSLTINGAGTLYQYNQTQGAGIGGDTGEMNGGITFAMTGSAFVKGTKQGAVIGAGANAKGNGVPGSITFESGTYNLETNSRGAAIGGSAGSGGASSGTEVYVKGGNININCDFTGSAVGGGGYQAGNDSSGGTVYITGGSLRTYIDKNAANNEYGGFNNAAFTEGVNDAVITAQRKNGDGENVYKCVFDTSELGDGPYTVQVDGKEYYSGGRHAWAYVNEALSKDEGTQISVSRTQDNWIPNDEPNLYFYLTGQDHTITVGDRTYQAEFLTAMFDENGAVADNAVYTSGAFEVKEASSGPIVEDCTERSETPAAWSFNEEGTDLTVTCSSACSVIAVAADGSCERIQGEAAETENTYSFPMPEGGSKIVIVRKGDVNRDGKLNVIDAAQTKAASLGKIVPSDALQSMLLDVSGDGNLNVIDAAQVKAATLGKISFSW